MEHNNIYKSVFKVTHSGGSGSCFYLKNYDLFVTNYHVVEGYRTVAVHDNDRNPYLAKVVLVNPALDIALLAAEGDFSALPEMTLAADDSLTIGRKVYVAGYPYGMPFTITEGSVSSPKQLMDGKYYIQTDAAVNPGNSGGPILNDAEEVVGVTVSKFTQADNMGFGIRVETLHGLLESLGELDRTAFQVQCGSCEELICEEEEFCPSCGDKLPEGVFDERELSPLGGFVESAIREMGVNPVLARDGYDSWLFHKGSSEIRIFVYDGNYLFSTSPINLLPKKEVENVLDYMLSEDFGPYKLGIEGRQIYIAYRIHLADITDESEDEIRKNIVNAGLVEGIVAMPTQLFFSTPIPVCLWFLCKGRPADAKTLFVDASNMGTMISRAQRTLTDEDIQKIAATFDAFRDGKLEEEKGFSAAVPIEDIAKQDYILTPGRYVGVAEQEEDDEPFDDKMKRLTEELAKCFEESNRLQAEIKKNLEAIGYGM